jgi:hypothetical protein
MMLELKSPLSIQSQSTLVVLTRNNTHSYSGSTGNRSNHLLNSLILDGSKVFSIRAGFNQGLIVEEGQNIYA